MSLWDPYSHDLYGNAITGRGPTVLRSPSGAQVTADQYLMAKRAYSVFCMRARTSAVTNPIEIGALPDGSQYRIATVGNQTYVDVWPVQPAVDETRGGIGIVLTDLSGGVLAEHSFLEDGVPTAQPYILTPVERKGTRNNTGRWKVRKESYQGGKASFYHPKSKRYVMGMEGESDPFLPPPPGNADMAGVNTRANRIGFRIDGTPIYTNRTPLPAGKFRGEFDMLPFFRYNASGQLTWVQIVPEFLLGTRLKMYAGPYVADETQYVGEFVFDLEVPDGYSLNYQTISPSPDGNMLRMVFRRASNSAFVAVDVAVSDTDLAIQGMTEYQAFVNGESATETTGSLPTGQTTVYYDRGSASVGLEYGYDGKGQPVTVRAGTAFMDTAFTRYQLSNSVVVGDVQTSTNTIQSDSNYVHPTSYLTVNGVRTEFPRPLERVLVDRTIVTTTFVPTSTTTNVTASGSSSIDRYEYVALLTLISDPVTSFVVRAVNLRHFTRASHPEASFDGTNWVVNTIIDSETEDYNGKLQVMCKGVVVDEIDVSNIDLVGRFVASIAADPVTGAICCNVLEFTDDTRDFVARSWIYVADDQGGKRLSQIMDVADSRDIRIRNDSTLLSV